MLLFFKTPLLPEVLQHENLQDACKKHQLQEISRANFPEGDCAIGTVQNGDHFMQQSRLEKWTDKDHEKGLIFCHIHQCWISSPGKHSQTSASVTHVFNTVCVF